MREPFDNLRPILVTLNLSVFVLIFCFGYLVIGDQVIAMFDRPEPMDMEAYRARVAKEEAEDVDRIENGIHVQSGLIYAEGFDIVRGTCTACHSAKLVTQNRATREGWEQMIRWMQETQGLWDLGKNEDAILTYLAQNYAPEEVGRRANLDVEAIEWYVLEMKYTILQYGKGVAKGDGSEN
jgi:hypothetical protein